MWPFPYNINRIESENDESVEHFKTIKTMFSGNMRTLCTTLPTI